MKQEAGTLRELTPDRSTPTSGLAWAPVLLRQRGMDLYDVKAAGIRGPLNSREISHLFRSGLLHRRVRCKPKGESNWRTIGELFPLLEYGFGGYSLPLEGSKSVGFRLALALLAALMATGVFLYCNRSVRDSTDIRVVTNSPSHQVVTPIVIVRSN